MKKILLISAIVLIAFISFLGFYLPDQYDINRKIYVKIPGNPLQRGVMSTERWKYFFPGDTLPNNSFKIENRIYNIIGKNVSSVDLESFSQESADRKWIANIAVDQTSDSSFISFHARLARPVSNLYTRFLAWIHSNQEEEDLESICQAAINYFSTIEHIYGYNIVQNNMPDLSMVSLKYYSPDTPNLQSIYGLIGKLRDAIKKGNTVPADSPMLNITRIAEKEIITMVAIPIPQVIPVSGEIAIKKMIPGNKLEVVIKGGEKELRNGIQAINNYIEDQQKTAPAIPYQVLKSYRLTTPDSLWITHLNYPIF